MKILVVGGGGREHALAWKCAQSTRVDLVHVAPGNAGTALEPKVRNAAIAADDVDALAAFAARERIDLTIVGPEGPLVAGIADRFAADGLACFGPTRAAARLEGSKAYTKAFLSRHGIPTAAYRSFTREDFDPEVLRRWRLPLVIKADGLAAGKGVVICDTHAQAVDAAARMLNGAFGAAGESIVVEEFLEGEEVSFIVTADGLAALPLATSQDHKRRDDGDRGPNTGGMGAYSPAPVVTPALHARIMREVIEPTLRGLRLEGVHYTGFLYAGLMLTPDGPALLETNVRCGDPETQVILPRVGVPLAPLLLAAARAALPAETPAVLPATGDAAVGIVLAARGYPLAPRRGDRIDGVGVAGGQGALVFHAGTAALGPDGGWATSGGRVLTVVGRGADLAEARAVAERAADTIHWDGVHRRRDIALRLPPKARVPA